MTDDTEKANNWLHERIDTPIRVRPGAEVAPDMGAAIAQAVVWQSMFPEPEPSGWLPIANAPTWCDILLYEDFEPAICKGYWHADDAEWRPSRGGQFFRPSTHWMPLSAPPEGGK